MRTVSFFKYFLVILISIELGFFSTTVNIKDIIKVVILYLIMELLIFICYKLKSNYISKKENNINAVIPHILIIFLTCVFNYRYGYGNTFGILGYEKDLGIFTVLNLPFKTCIFVLFLSYVSLCCLTCIKLFLKYPSRKIAIIAFALLEIVVFLMCLSLYFSRHHLFDSLMLLTLLTYLIFYIGVELVTKKIT